MYLCPLNYAFCVQHEIAAVNQHVIAIVNLTTSLIPAYAPTVWGVDTMTHTPRAFTASQYK